MFEKIQTNIARVAANAFLLLLVGAAGWLLVTFRPWQPAPGPTPGMLACAKTVSGDISADATWQAADSPVCLTTTITVGPYAALTIQPGVTVQAQNAAGLVIQGRLHAAGTAAQPITFTSAADSAAGQWIGLVFDGYYGEGRGTLAYATVRYAGAQDGSRQSGVRLQSGAQVTMDHVQVLNNQGNGVEMIDDASRLVVTQSMVQNNSGYPLVVSTDGAAQASANVFSGNQPDRVLINAGVTLTVRSSGTWRKNNGSGVYELGNETIVAEEAALTLEPGVTVMARDSVPLIIQGVLNAVGTATQPITFTSAANSGAGQWTGLVFDGYNNYSRGTLAYVTIRYAGQPYWSQQANLLVKTAVVEVSHCQILDSAGNGVWMSGDGHVTFASNTVSNSAGYGMVTYLQNLSGVTGNVFTNNHPNRVLVQPGTLDAP